MTSEHAVLGWYFWLRWVLLTVLGYTVGLLVGFGLGHALLGNVMIGVGIGAVTGFLQWLALRRHIQRSGWWVLASVVGLSVSLGLYAVVHNIWGYPFDLGWPLGVLGWALAFLLGGALIGLPQQWILRRRVGLSAWWVPISAAGWALSVLGLSISLDLSENLPDVVDFLYLILSPAVAGLILGTVTGGALIWLFRQPTLPKLS